MCFLGHVLNLKIDVEEMKLSLSAYKTIEKRRMQIVVIMIGRESFFLRSFIVSEGFMRNGRRLKM